MCVKIGSALLYFWGLCSVSNIHYERAVRAKRGALFTCTVCRIGWREALQVSWDI